MSPLEYEENPVISHVSPKATAVQTAVEAQLNADLALILDAWPTLPTDIKAALVSIAKANRSP